MPSSGVLVFLLGLALLVGGLPLAYLWRRDRGGFWTALVAVGGLLLLYATLALNA